jgi:serine/threonine protein kinase
MAGVAAGRLRPETFRLFSTPRRSRSVPRATAPSSSAPTPESAEPFTLGLRRDAEDALVLGEPIGRGAMGVVRSCTRRSDGNRFALKTIPKAGPQSLEGATPAGEAMAIWERKVRDEVNLHFALGASLDIVTLHDAFEDEAGVHLLIDLCDGGDLLTGTSNEQNEDGGSFAEDAEASDVASSDERIDASHQSRSNESWKPFTEAAAATTIRAVLRALAACHAHGVVHRDVKPANFLYMREPDGSRRAKLSDFGLAARIKERDGVLTERCGTYAYLSPEMARRRPYDFKVDAWAAGVVAYMLLAGEPPFADWDAIRDGRNPTREGLLRAIRRGRPAAPVDDLPLSPGAKSLLKALLEPNPEKRMSCAAAAEHYWVRERGAASHADALAETVVEKLQAYGTLGAVRRACLRAAFEEFAENESRFVVESGNQSDGLRIKRRLSDSRRSVGSDAVGARRLRQAGSRRGRSRRARVRRARRGVRRLEHVGNFGYEKRRQRRGFGTGVARPRRGVGARGVALADPPVRVWKKQTRYTKTKRGRVFEARRVRAQRRALRRARRASRGFVRGDGARRRDRRRRRRVFQFFQ